jgi:hypothetical protein
LDKLLFQCIEALKCTVMKELFPQLIPEVFLRVGFVESDNSLVRFIDNYLGR